MLALCLVAVIMRPAITALGPLIDRISVDTAIPLAILGALPTIILITWALMSPFGHSIGRRLGLGGAVFGALAVLGAGLIIRSLPGSNAWLWLGTALIGVALAIGNVLMPAVIKRDFPLRIPLMMGIYSAILGGAGAVASGLAVPIANIFGNNTGAGWRVSLLVTGGLILPFAFIAWWLTTRGQRFAQRANNTPHSGIWRDPVAWLVAVYMGVQSTSFYVLVTWLAPMSLTAGRDATAAGIDVMTYQLFSLIGSLTVAIAMRGKGGRITPALLPVLGILGIVCLIIWPGAIGYWVIPLGLFSGASLGVSLTLMAQRARDHSASSALSGMSQSVGYLIAAIGPVLFGAVHAFTNTWSAALCILLLMMGTQIAVGAFAARDRFVLSPRA